MGITEADLPELLRRAVVRGGADGDPYEKSCALARLAVAVAAVDRDRSRALYERGRDLARSFSGAGQRGDLLEAALAAGGLDLAEELALSAPEENSRVAGLLKLMRLTPPEDAPRLAGEIEALILDLAEPGEAASNAVSLAARVAGEDPERARALIEYAEGLFPSPLPSAPGQERARVAAMLGDPERAVWTAAELAKVAAVLGDRERVRIFTGRAEALVSACPENRAAVLTELMEAAALLGEESRVQALLAEVRVLISAVADPYERVGELLGLVLTLHEIGDENRASAAADETELLIPEVPDPLLRALSWTALAAEVLLWDPARARLLASRARVPPPSSSLFLWSMYLTGLDAAIASEPARDLLDRVHETGSWPVCLTAGLAAFPDPSARTLRTTADVLLGLPG
ncbi:hypothetical protein ABGB12_05930 [Actinocorallia sp. B10E7]|uniref:hypothetical protein n=1 Tax=Actinocorallia sp. B10E7 TaxID=3153558 RepID=UPI00325C4242